MPECEPGLALGHTRQGSYSEPVRIARFTTGEDPAYGLVDGAGEKIAEITGDPLYQRIELTGATHLVEDVRLLAPVIPRSKVIGIGRNYAEHAAEMGGEAPAEPLMFLIPNTAQLNNTNGQFNTRGQLEAAAANCSRKS